MFDITRDLFFVRRFAVRALGLVVAVFGASRADAAGVSYNDAYFLSDHVSSQVDPVLDPDDFSGYGTDCSDDGGSGSIDFWVYNARHHINEQGHSGCIQKLRDLGLCEGIINGSYGYIMNECGIGGYGGSGLNCATSGFYVHSGCSLVINDGTQSGYGKTTFNYVSGCGDNWHLFSAVSWSGGSSTLRYAACQIYGEQNLMCRATTESYATCSDYFYNWSGPFYAGSGATVTCTGSVGCTQEFQDHFNSYIGRQTTMSGTCVQEWNAATQKNEWNVYVGGYEAALISEYCGDSGIWSRGCRATICSKYGPSTGTGVDGYFVMDNPWPGSDRVTSGACLPCRYLGVPVVSGIGYDEWNFYNLDGGPSTSCVADGAGGDTDPAGTFQVRASCQYVK